MNILIRKLVKKIPHYKKDLLAVTLGQVIAALGTLLGVRLLTEYIPPAIFGEYKLLLAVISLIIGIFVRPFIQFAMREYHDAVNKNIVSVFFKRFKSLFLKYIIWVAILFVAIISLFSGELITVSSYLLLLLPVMLVLQSSLDLKRALMVTRNEQISANIISISQKWLVPIAVVIVVRLTAQTPDMMFFATICVLASILFVQRQAAPKMPPLESDIPMREDIASLSRDAFRYGLPLAGVGLLGWVVHESDRFFLSYYHSNEVVGIYSAAYGLVSAPFTLVVGSMVQFLYPIMFRVSASGNQESKINLLKAMLISSSLICSIGVIGVGLFDEQIAWLALGENYRHEATGLLIWIALGYSFFAVSMSFELVVFGGKKTIDMFYAYGFAAILNVTLNIALIPDHGAMGAVIATLISLFFYLIVMAALFLYRERNQAAHEITS